MKKNASQHIGLKFSILDTKLKVYIAYCISYIYIRGAVRRGPPPVEYIDENFQKVEIIVFVGENDISGSFLAQIF